jgi:nucleoside-diphosphate kinase
MSSGPIVAMILSGDDVIARNRKIMGATDPKKADKGTIRADLADSVEQNIVHGSDAPETSATEIAYFFSVLDIVS